MRLFSKIKNSQHLLFLRQGNRQVKEGIEGYGNLKKDQNKSDLRSHWNEQRGLLLDPAPEKELISLGTPGK